MDGDRILCTKLDVDTETFCVKETKTTFKMSRRVLISHRIFRAVLKEDHHTIARIIKRFGRLSCVSDVYTDVKGRDAVWYAAAKGDMVRLFSSLLNFLKLTQHNPLNRLH